MHIGEICTRSVVTCRRDASAKELAGLMRKHHVGDVIVVDEHEGRMTPAGVVTDRDLVVKVLALGIDPAGVRAGDLMASDVATAFTCAASRSAGCPWSIHTTISWVS